MDANYINKLYHIVEIEKMININQKNVIENMRFSNAIITQIKSQNNSTKNRSDI